MCTGLSMPRHRKQTICSEKCVHWRLTHSSQWETTASHYNNTNISALTLTMQLQHILLLDVIFHMFAHMYTRYPYVCNMHMHAQTHPHSPPPPHTHTKTKQKQHTHTNKKLKWKGQRCELTLTIRDSHFLPLASSFIRIFVEHVAIQCKMNGQLVHTWGLLELTLLYTVQTNRSPGELSFTSSHP